MTEFDRLALSWFLDYTNDWLTVDAFASARGVSPHLAFAMIEHGKAMEEIAEREETS